MRRAVGRIRSVRQTRAWGIWEVVLILPDGREVVGNGLTPQQAEYRARLRAAA